MSRPVEPTPALVEALRGRLDHIRTRIARAAERADRDPRAVRLVVVTKSANPVQAAAVVAAGATDLGENRIQDAEPRMAAVAATGAQPVWHMIGHLQRNKVRPTLERFDRIDSLDSLRLARRIDRLAAELGRRVPVLLQVNASSDPAKHGFEPRELPAALARIAALDRLELEGLMTILLHTGDEARLRQDFGRMRALQERLRREPEISIGPSLSMGMTEDFEIAVEEGATELRIGRAIFADLPPA